MIRIILLFFLLSTVAVKAQTTLQGLKEPFAKYRVSTTECSKIIHPSGTIIFIPDLAFDVDTKEAPHIDLFYREMRDPIDMAIYGFNMRTKLMGKTHFLESNGMFEIFATNGADTVQVHEDRSIFVHFAIQAKKVDLRMEAFKYNNQDSLWDSYNRIDNRFIVDNDDDLWGSSAASFNESSIQLSGNEEWMEAEMVVQDSLREVAFQAMEIFEFGIYNYDKIITGEVYIPVMASFVDQKNNPLKSTVYVIYTDINSVFYFDPYTWKSDFFLIKGKNYSMFTVDRQGKIFKLKNYPVFTEDQEQQITFTLIDEGLIPDTKTKLSNLIGTR